MYAISDDDFTADDPWGGMDSTNTTSISNPWDSAPDPWQTNPTPTYPSLSSQPKKLVVPSKNRAASITSSQRSTPVSSPPPPDTDGWEPAGGNAPASAPLTPNLTGMNKEEKAAEMARRKEERKQVSSLRIRP